MPTINKDTATIKRGNYRNWYVTLHRRGCAPIDMPMYAVNLAGWVEDGGVIIDPEHYLDADEPVSAAQQDRDSAEPLGWATYRSRRNDHLDWEAGDYYGDLEREG